MSSGAEPKEVEEEMEETNLALGSSSPLALPQEQDHLPSGDPLLPHLVPHHGPAAGGEGSFSFYKAVG